MKALKEISVSSPERIDEIVWFHDAGFHADEISVNEENETVTVVFDQAVGSLPDDLDLPSPKGSGRGWLNYIRFHELMPFVECELVVRQASGFDLDDDQTWGMLNDASYDSNRQIVRISSVFGPNIDVHVNGFEITVRISDRIRSYRHITTWFCIFEGSGKRLPA